MGTERTVEGRTEHSDDAWSEVGPGGPTMPQLAARIDAKIEEAAQGQGLLVPPGMAGDVEPIEGTEYAEEAEEPSEDEAEEQAGDEAEDDAGGDEKDEQAEGESADDGEATDDGEDEFFVARYKSKEEAERGLAEKDATINRLYRQLHEQRQQIEESLAAAAEGEIDEDAWNSWAEEQVANGAGASGALAALESGGRDGYNLYLAHWMGDEDQRAAAVAFNNEVMLELAEQRARQAVTSGNGQPSGAAEQSAEAKRLLAAQYDDFDAYKDEIDRLVTEPGALPADTADWLASIAGQGVEGKRRAYEFLYLQAARTTQPRRQKADATEKKRRRVSGDAAKVAATVSSSEGAPARTPPAAGAEKIALDVKNAIRAEAGLPLLSED